MVELVAIPKDLFERMADAVGELEALLDSIDDPRHDRFEALHEEIEDKWPEESFDSDPQVEPEPGFAGQVTFGKNGKMKGTASLKSWRG